MISGSPEWAEAGDASRFARHVYLLFRLAGIDRERSRHLTEEHVASRRP